MRPNLSVLLLTTLIGAGQGLFVALFTVELGALFGLLPAPREPWFYFHGSLIAFVLTGGGLIASFFHLGRPGRAWRSAARWRTSWLSREVLILPAFMAVVLVYAIAHFFHWGEALARSPSGVGIDATVVLGLAGTALALALYVCTGMIYACLPFLREWASPLTVVNFTLMGMASGFTLAAAFSVSAAPGLARFLAGTALTLTLSGLATRVASLIRNERLRPKSTLQTAIGIKHPKITQQSMGFMGGSFNTREFFHGRAIRFVRGVKWGFLAGAFVIPALLLAASLSLAPPSVLLPAFLVQYAGLLSERWFFFAQANHPQNLYYQAVT
jgi:DMSO reductase anchor subunit